MKMNLGVLSRWSDDLSYRVKGLILLLFPLLALLVVFWLVGTVASGRRMAEEWAANATRVSFCTQGAEMHLWEMESQLGTYFLTGNADLLREHANSRLSLLAVLSQLAEVASYPGARKQVADIRDVISGEDNKLWTVQEGSPDQPATTTLGPQTRVRFLEAIGLLRDGRSKLESVASEENRLLTFRLSHQEHVYSELFLTAIAIACLAPILGFALNLFISARVAKRLVGLQKFVHLLVHEMPMMPVPGGKDEVGQLGTELRVAASALDEREHELLRRDQHLFDVFERAPVALHEIDSHGVICRANQAGCDLLGYEAGEILGKHAWELVSPDEQPACLAMVMGAIQGEPPRESLAQDYLRKDGSRIRLSLRLQAIDVERGPTKSLCSALLSVSVA